MPALYSISISRSSPSPLSPLQNNAIGGLFSIQSSISILQLSIRTKLAMVRLKNVFFLNANNARLLLLLVNYNQRLEYSGRQAVLLAHSRCRLLSAFHSSLDEVFSIIVPFSCSLCGGVRRSIVVRDLMHLATR